MEEGRFGPFEEGPVVRGSAGGAADRDDIVCERWVHAGPVISLLGAHREPNHSVQVVDAQTSGQEVTLSAHAVAVVEIRGEVLGVRRRGGFAVAEHGDDDDVVGGEGACGGGEC